MGQSTGWRDTMNFERGEKGRDHWETSAGTKELAGTIPLPHSSA